MNKNLNDTNAIEQEPIGQNPFEISSNEIGVLERFALASDNVISFGGKYIDLRIVFVTSLGIAIGWSQKKLLRKAIIYTARFLRNKTSREQRRRLLDQTKKYFNHYRSLEGFRNYHANLVMQLPLKQKTSFLISVAIGIFIGAGLFILKNCYRF